jgi:uncharacterized YigZ family protein
MDDSYKTLESPAEGTYREKGSRFLAFGFPLQNEEEIRTILAGLRKKYHDARHHCYAYRLGPNGDTYRINDDGEPSGTAGKPIYGQMLSSNLTQVLIVVVRYFGGTLLGTGGLITAYRSATADMISHAKVIVRLVEVKVRLFFPYDMLNAVMKILKEESLSPGEADYNTMCTLVVKVRASSLDKLTGRVKMVAGLQYESLKMDD